MKNLNLVLMAGAAILGCCAPAFAAPACLMVTNQAITAGFACTLGDLTFTFENVSFVSPNSTTSDTIALEAPPTGTAGNVDILGFQLFAIYPVDIHLVYEVQSTSSNIIGLDSSFTPSAGSQIQESACGTDPESPVNEGSCTPLLGTVINSSGAITYTPTFGPVSTLWVDKDVTDTGFSSFTDSIEESAVPEPASGLLLGAALCGLGLIGRKRSKA
jgi:hypothetical protein